MLLHYADYMSMAFGPFLFHLLYNKTDVLCLQGPKFCSKNRMWILVRTTTNKQGDSESDVLICFDTKFKS